MRRFMILFCLQMLIFSIASASATIHFPSETELFQKVDVKTGKYTPSNRTFPFKDDGIVTDSKERVLKFQGSDSSIPYYFFYREGVTEIVNENGEFYIVYHDQIDSPYLIEKFQDGLLVSAEHIRHKLTEGDRGKKVVKLLSPP